MLIGGDSDVQHNGKLLFKECAVLFINFSVLVPSKTKVIEFVEFFKPEKMGHSHVTYLKVKRIFEGKPPQNLNSKNQQWKIMLNMVNTTFKKKKIKRVKSNIFHVIIVAI